MEELPLTSARLARIWWAFVWRFFVLVFAAGIALGIVLGLGAVLLRLNPQQLETSGMLQLLVTLLLCGAFYLVLRWIFLLKFPDFRIVLVRRVD